MSRVGQNHTFIGIYGVHTVFLAGKSPYIRSFTVQIGIRFWPTLRMCADKFRNLVSTDEDRVNADT